jgi:hypothetical protein
LPTTTSPTGLCQQDKRNPVGKAFADRIKAFADSFKLSAKRAFPVVVLPKREPKNTKKSIYTVAIEEENNSMI